MTVINFQMEYVLIVPTDFEKIYALESDISCAPTQYYPS